MPDPHLDELWQNVLAAWNDDAAHAAFLDGCRADGKLGVAAARYREELKRASAHDEDAAHLASAQKRLDAVAMLAMFELDHSRGALPEDAQRAGRVLRWVAGLLLLGISVFALLRFIAR